MYTEYFGLQEKPFTITPNPAFLFLSKIHKEAFAHLLFGVQHHAGFIELTGEVGTGKTTVLRTLLNQLDTEDYRLAFIFNPSLSAQELLQSICREFGLPADTLGAADLHSSLNRFLLTENQAGRTVVLVIDEAQNLKPEVLEQIRLLSNLETETDKLIQILLVGQPELGQMLDAPNLRQLSQRITVRYHLQAMDPGDTRAYIRHRLEIAGLQRGELFSAAASKGIYRLSQGYPRLINILCDRSLLVAYGEKQRLVGRRHVRQAEVELQRQGGRPPSRNRLLAALALIVLLVGFGFAGFWWQIEGRALVLSQMSSSQVLTPPRSLPVVPNPNSQIPQTIAKIEPTQETEQPTVADQETSEIGEAVDRAETDSLPSLTAWRHFLAGQSSAESGGLAIQSALLAWGRGSDSLGEVAPAALRSTAREAGLELTSFSGNYEDLLSTGVPALAECYLPGVSGRRFFALLGENDNSFLVSKGPDQSNRMPLEVLQSLWTGRGYLLWKNHEQLPFVGTPGERSAGVNSLQRLLRQAGFRSLVLSGEYDLPTIDAVAEFQRAVGIAQDGRIGPQTLMLLYRAAGYPQPAVRPEKDSGGAV